MTWYVGILGVIATWAILNLAFTVSRRMVPGVPTEIDEDDTTEPIEVNRD